MLQWHDCKKKAVDAVLLFRLGDFYEAFYADAKTIAKELDLTLTKRQDIPMAGIPFHTSEAYVDKLVAKGYKVAIAEQMEDPKEVKGIVKREVVRIVTPGTVIHSSLLSANTNNFLASICVLNQTFGLSLLDLTTAEFKVLEFEHFSALCDELLRTKPKELLISTKNASLYKESLAELGKEIKFSLSVQDDRYFEHREAVDSLTKHFGVQSLDGFGLRGMISAINAAGCLLCYVSGELRLSVEHIQTIRKEEYSKYMALDGATLRHLEIMENLADPTGGCTLLHHLDKTLTPPGGRLMKFWISRPLLSPSAIIARQEVIEFFLTFPKVKALQESLAGIRDLERLIMKIETGFAGPRDLLALRLSLEELPMISALLSTHSAPLLTEELAKLADVSSVASLLATALQDNLPLKLTDGNIIREGFHAELDELRGLSKDSRTWIAEYQTRLREETTIKTLKVGYTKAFGYYIEVSRGQAEKMPSFFERRQTLVNAERFVTQELKEYEHKVLSAEERISGIETVLFHEIRKEVATHGKTIREIASAIAHIDCLQSLAAVASANAYTRPTVDEGSVLLIEEGRHPVIETQLRGDSFIPNDVHIGDFDRSLFVITGPNMAGKSTFIRQVALIAILVQIGSFVPAKKVHAGIIDKVFTRIGASDNLSRGQSTFMVEMSETANILHNATERSLVILDEIGRGTSTYDGISLAWAIAEYLLTTDGKKAKTLFATHYYELTALEEKIPGAVNYSIAVRESDKGIVFLRKIVKGATDKSYGIHVAKLAGLPGAVLKKAQEMLKMLEKSTPRKHKGPKEEQLSFFSLPPENPILEEIRNIRIDHITPIQALQQLLDWKNRIAAK